ncbi:MAG: enoyl-CoA hydratase/isomerase family protein [Dehalococcoidia bacterium]|nr:enoyl-CoA hydratase/isomerase family protein [Dehalococcoidia bacterium]
MEYVIYEKSEGVGAITINRPAKLNAITFEMLDEMWEVLQDIQGDRDVNVVLLAGAGRYFSAGADLSIVGSITPETFRLRQGRYWNRVFSEFEEMGKLTIAALNGPALGGGLELALCCDLRYASEDATFSLPEINFGIVPDSGATVRLPWLIGVARAKELILSGDTITAKQAEDYGLVNRVFPRDSFAEEVRRVAVKMASRAPLALGMGKKLIHRSFQQADSRFGLEQAMDVQSALILTEDYREAIDAYREKRPPRFKGR